MKEKIIQSIAWMLPKELAYWVALRVIAHATTSNQYSSEPVYSIPAMETLRIWRETA